MLVQIQEQKQSVKLSEILKNATEEQCFGQFMKISENTDYQTTSIIKSTVKVCVNGLQKLELEMDLRLPYLYMNT